MSDKVCYPPSKWYTQEDEKNKLVFLCGSLNDAVSWQPDAIEMLHSKSTELYIASPLGGVAEEDQQISWELYHIRMASATGVILFWLSKECQDQRTIYQVGEWLQNIKYRIKYQPERPLKVVVGIEPGFCLEKYITFRITDELPGMPIFNNLEDACKEVLNIL